MKDSNQDNRKIGNCLIPQSVDDSEVLVRCIGHFLYYSNSKKKIKRTAYLPPPGSNEVSVLRLNYASETKCKQHAKSIKKNSYEYCGLSASLCSKIKDIVKDKIDPDLQLKEPSLAIIKIKASPLNENFHKRNEDKIYTSDKGLPFHADIIYNWTAQQGKPAPTIINKIAQALTKNPPTSYHKDICINDENWTSGKIQVN